MSINIKINKAKLVSKKEEKAIQKLLMDCFPDNQIFKSRIHANKDLDICILAFDGKYLIGHLDIIKRLVNYRNKYYLIGGIGDVAVSNKYRRLGVGALLLEKAKEILEDENYNLGLLFCHPNLHNFYSSSGWKKKKSGKIYAIVNGVKENQRLTYYLPIKLDDEDIKIWNNKNIIVGQGSW